MRHSATKVAQPLSGRVTLVTLIDREVTLNGP